MHQLAFFNILVRNNQRNIQTEDIECRIGPSIQSHFIDRGNGLMV